MTPLTAAWLALLVLLVTPATLGVCRQWHMGDISPRDACATLLIIAGLTLATISVIAIEEVTP